MAAILSVTSSLLVGIILIVVPWTTLWEGNYLLQPYPALRMLLLSGAMRGTVSALGVVNIVLALAEAYEQLRARGERM